jgi:hypothetical protein
MLDVGEFLEVYYGIIIPDRLVTLSEFEKIKEDNNIDCWDYPLDEYAYLAGNNIDAVLVRFKDGDGYDYRFCEWLKED